jgi:long-chain acyl-CoA synthetase
MDPQLAPLTEVHAPQTAYDMFLWRVRHDPNSVFIITPDGTERTYAQLAQRARQLALALATAGIRRGDVVGLHLANEPAWVVALIACWQLGAVAACCGSLTPAAEAVRRFELGQARLVIAAGDTDAFGGLKAIRVSSEGVPQGSTADESLAHLLLGADALGADELAAILFTSGTTGQPKAIPKMHSDIAGGARMTAGAYAKAAGFRPRAAPTGLAPAVGLNPFGHSAPIGRMVFRMYVGRALVLAPKFDVALMAQIAGRYPLDALQLTPAMIHALAYAEIDIQFKALKYVTSGTAPLPVATRDRFEQRFGVPVLQAYGSTEGTVTALERYEDVVAGRRGRGSVGRIPADMPHRIVDLQGRDVAPGEEGELLGRPKRVPAGQVSANLSSPATDADGWVHTGDLARIDSHGILYITGRLKEMMIVGGFNVYPGEVEDVLAHFEPIREIVVVAFPDERLGEVPVAGIVWANTVKEDERAKAWESIAVAAREKLEAYKVPRRWFALSELPRNLTGKVDRNEAVKLAVQFLGTEPE